MRDLLICSTIIGSLMGGAVIFGNISLAMAQTAVTSGAGMAPTTSATNVNVTGGVNGTRDPIGITGTAATGVTGHVSGAMKEGKPITGAGNTPSSATVGAWSSERNYWQSEYPRRPYYNSTTNYQLYEPAYQYGYNAYNQNPGKRFDELDQLQLRSNWDANRGNSTLTWDQAQQASRDAYERLYNNRIKIDSSTSTKID